MAWLLRKKMRIRIRVKMTRIMTRLRITGSEWGSGWELDWRKWRPGRHGSEGLAPPSQNLLPSSHWSTPGRCKTSIVSLFNILVVVDMLSIPPGEGLHLGNPGVVESAKGAERIQGPPMVVHPFRCSKWHWSPWLFFYQDKFGSFLLLCQNYQCDFCESLLGLFWHIIVKRAPARTTL